MIPERGGGRCLLVDIDSTIPNLALMQISAWKKAQGYDAVGFNVDDPTEVYASVIFDWNRHKADGLRWFYPNARIDVGGSGYDMTKQLPSEVSLMKPDYSLYPDMDYDLGFTTRGCIRRCPFCIVPRKEGAFRIHQHPSAFHDEAHRKAVLMDNNILADRGWFFTVTDWLLANDMAVDFNQGLDLRLMDEGIAARIAELKPMNKWRFAFDSMAYRDSVERGLGMLKDAGVNIRGMAMAYVYLDGPQDLEDAVARAEILRGLGVMPYPMFNRHARRTPAMTAFKRWCRPWLFFTFDWKDYNGHI